MCGSGTFLVEAALIAADAAPGLLRRGRRWPLEAWHDFDGAAWRAAVGEAEAARRPWGGTILGNDVHEVRACAGWGWRRMMGASTEGMRGVMGCVHSNSA